MLAKEADKTLTYSPPDVCYQDVIGI